VKSRGVRIEGRKGSNREPISSLKFGRMLERDGSLKNRGNNISEEEETFEGEERRHSTLSLLRTKRRQDRSASSREGTRGREEPPAAKKKSQGRERGSFAERSAGKGKKGGKDGECPPKRGGPRVVAGRVPPFFPGRGGE